MTPDGDLLLEELCVALSRAGIPVVAGEACGQRAFVFEVGGDLTDEQEAELNALCAVESVKLDLQSPNHRRVIDHRVAR